VIQAATIRTIAAAVIFFESYKHAKDIHFVPLFLSALFRPVLRQADEFFLSYVRSQHRS
jgi:hypothetical protein